ncbi:MAG: efflux RND transporter periplasmic adaptor subunit, partial [Pseudomonadota bacterium]
NGVVPYQIMRYGTTLFHKKLANEGHQLKYILILKRKFGLILALLGFTLVVLWGLDDTPRTEPNAETVLPVMSVTVVTVRPETTEIGLDAIGIGKARWSVAVTATVSGHVEFVHEDLVPGQLIKADTVLVKIEDLRFRSDLAQARANLAEAKLQLAKVRNEQHVTIQLGKAKSAFGRREPHVKAAEVQLQASNSLVETAKQRLNDTEIVAPFPAILLGEQVSPGQYINAGDELFHLASSASLDVMVELSADQWRRLGHLGSETWVEVSTPQGKIWDAKLRYLNPVMDATTRQRSLVLEVAEPYSGTRPLLPDEQVEVHFPGPELTNVVRAPASALTEDGQVWTVFEGRLVLESIELLDETPDHILFRYQQYPSDERQLVQFPLGTMLSGQRVNTQFDTAVGLESQS